MQFHKESLNFFKILGLLILFGYPSVSKASHIVGGEMTYRFLYRQPNTNINVYQMTLRVYRDIFAFNENGRATPFDASAFTLVHLKMPSGTYQRVNITAVDITSQRNLPRPEIPCSQTPKDVGYAEAIYSWSLFLPDTNGTYIISYQRCCRNATISNIGPPSANTFSAVYSVEISPESQRLGNSSPVFTALPPPFVCEGDPMQIDLSATDADGDQIVYRFCNAFRDAPIIPPGNPPRPQMPPFGIVPFRPPYTVDAPMKGNPLIKLDANTGLITGTPDPIRPFFGYIYQQYVMTVCAEEYRNGRLIGRIYRDFQLNVVVCKRLVVAALVADSTADKAFFYKNCGSNSLKINNQSYERANIPNYRWEFLVRNDTVRYSDWSPTVDFPEAGVYKGKLLLNPGTKCADTAYLTVNIGGQIVPNFVVKFDTCAADSVAFRNTTRTNVPFKQILWNFGDNSLDSNKMDVKHKYAAIGDKSVKLSVKDFYGCSADTTIRFTWQPAPPVLIVEPNNFTGCAPLNVQFINRSSPIDTSFKIDWDFGDGTVSKAISPIHTYAKADTYSIKLTIMSPLGCLIQREFKEWIKVKSRPKADFDWTPKVINNLKPQVSFLDKSTPDVVNWRWYFSEKGYSNQQNPPFTYRDTGAQQVKLYVINQNGCPDSIVKTVYIESEMTFFLPNSFSPNFDSVNDEFKGTGFLFGLKSFRLSIWNRWGEKIFETHNPLEGWNGAKNNAGRPEPEGVYLYEAEWTTPKNEVKNRRDFLTLFR